MQQPLTLMDVLQPNRGIRAIFNSLLDGHRLHQDETHQHWRSQLAADPTGLLETESWHQDDNPGEYHHYITHQHLARQTPCFAYSAELGIHILPSVPSEDGSVWVVEMDQGYEWTLNTTFWFDGRSSYVVMRANCADFKTAIRMRNDYIQHGYYPQTDQLRLANHRARMEEPMHAVWRQRVDDILTRHRRTHRSRRVDFLSLSPEHREEFGRLTDDVQNRIERRLRTWLPLDRHHRPTPNAQLVAATGLDHFCF